MEILPIKQQDWFYIWRGDIVNRGDRNVFSPIRMLTIDILLDIVIIIDDFNNLENLSTVENHKFNSWNEFISYYIPQTLSFNKNDSSTFNGIIYETNVINLDIIKFSKIFPTLIDFDKLVSDMIPKIYNRNRTDDTDTIIENLTFYLE